MPIQQDNTLGNLGSILSAIPGLSQAINGETSTSSTSVSQQGLSYLLNQILSSNQGLASVAGGQNTAGMYNSTVQTQMVNDLLSRSAGEVASKNATTTTSKAPTLNLGDTLLQGAAGLIGTKLLSKGVDTLGSTVADALGIGASGFSPAAATSAFSSAAGFGGGAGGFTMPVVDAASSALGGAGAGSAAAAASAGSVAEGGAGTAGLTGVSAGTGVGADAAGAAGSGIGSALGATGAGALDAGLGAALGAGTAGAIGAATAGGMAAGGAALSGLGGAIAGDVAASTAGIAAASGVGAGAGAAAGGIGLGDAIMSILPAALAWVVCTELETQGVMSHGLYAKAAPDFVSRQRLKPSAVRGYHYWAVRYTRIMRRKDWIGRLAVAAIKPLALGRANYIAGHWNICGWATFNILEPICSFIGKTVARKKTTDWKQLYSQDQGE